jgi:hypothetical protein
MKKVLLAILFISYLAVTSGIVVNFHYCMNRLASTEWFTMEGKQCGRCGMEIHKSHGCCHDEVKVVKMDDDQKIASIVSFELPSLDMPAQVPSDFISTSFYNGDVTTDPDNHPPPLLSGQDTYLSNCVFRI